MAYSSMTPCVLVRAVRDWVACRACTGLGVLVTALSDGVEINGSEQLALLRAIQWKPWDVSMTQVSVGSRREAGPFSATPKNYGHTASRPIL